MREATTGMPAPDTLTSKPSRSESGRAFLGFNDMARGERTLITRWEPHDNDILRILCVVVGNDQVHDLIIDDASIHRVIHGTATTDQELSRLFLGAGLLQEPAKARAEVNDVGDS
jgi:hypothetical protein